MLYFHCILVLKWNNTLQDTKKKHQKIAHEADIIVLDPDIIVLDTDKTYPLSRILLSNTT